jgi:2-polyprenyl-3-methyl-5-hydroxy-6-metoxy-1,4-benzoquinol methylase
MRSADVEQAIVCSNVRRFVREQFPVWRCASCGSIHADREVDLAAYYRAYPMHAVGLDWRARAVYGLQLRRLVQAGFRREHSLLDHGCGSGAFIDFLRGAGYQNVVGYDAYNPRFADDRTLGHRYECVIAQDVLEHAEDPWQLLTVLRNAVAPKGLIALGTPNASAIDLKRPAVFVHTLHQPYHRHIASRRALLDLGRPLGWSLLEYLRTSYINTRTPFINLPFLFHYLRCRDNTFDAALEPVQPSLRLLSPRSLFLGFFGSLLAPETDVMVMYRAL